MGTASPSSQELLMATHQLSATYLESKSHELIGNWLGVNVWDNVVNTHQPHWFSVCDWSDCIKMSRCWPHFKAPPTSLLWHFDLPPSTSAGPGRLTEARQERSPGEPQADPLRRAHLQPEQRRRDRRLLGLRIQEPTQPGGHSREGHGRGGADGRGQLETCSPGARVQTSALFLPPELRNPKLPLSVSVFTLASPLHTHTPVFFHIPFSTFLYPEHSCNLLETSAL